MAKINSSPQPPQPDDLDAFFAAADQNNWDQLHNVAQNLSKTEQPPASAPAPARADDHDSHESNVFALTPEEEAALLGEENMAGKFVAIDPATLPGMTADDPEQPFVLIPANIHQYVPRWAWVAIVASLVMLVAGIIFVPAISLSRLTSRLGDANETTARRAMRTLILNGDDRTVRKLYDVASSSNALLTTRLRAVDTMSLIERVPEVDKALLRLELSAGTHDQVREAAIAARRQREAYRTRGSQ